MMWPAARCTTNWRGPTAHQTRREGPDFFLGEVHTRLEKTQFHSQIRCVCVFFLKPATGYDFCDEKGELLFMCI